MNIRLKNINLYFKTLLIVIFVPFCSVTVNAKAQCKKATITEEAFKSWFNPKPARTDFSLPLHRGLKLVFTRVELSSSGPFDSDERSIYLMGSKLKGNKGIVFETPLEVRVGSAIVDDSKRSIFLFGKYEISKAQYASIMSKGDRLAGLKILHKKSRDIRVQKGLKNFLDPNSDCHKVMTKAIIALLAEPVTFLNYRDYVEMIDQFNLFCISNRKCSRNIKALSQNSEYPAFVRLPTEHEWEYIARGGMKYAAGELGRSKFQSNLPEFEPGKSIIDYSHINGTPSRLLPIGSFDALHGFYDMFGNAQELMLNPFTTENGFGAVGAYVARGGHYKLPESELRVSKRVELMVFRRDEDTQKFITQYFPRTGLRLTIGLPIAGWASQTGSKQLQNAFKENFNPISEAGDKGGSIQADARDLGRLTKNKMKVSDKIGNGDKVDYYTVRTNQFGSIDLQLESDAALRVAIENLDGEILFKKVGKTGLKSSFSVHTQRLLPDKYFIKVSLVGSHVKSTRYDLTMTNLLVADSGIKQPDRSKFKTAKQVNTKNTLHFNGYVGLGDTTDTFPILISNDYGGLFLKLVNLTNPVTLTLLDKELNVIASKTSVVGSKNLVLNAPAPPRGGAFVQVRAKSTVRTLYKLAIQAKRPFDRLFSAKKSGASKISPNRTYSGFLSSSANRIYAKLPIYLSGIATVELTGLTGDIDLDIVDNTGKFMDRKHHRSGIVPEFFSNSLSFGDYWIRLSLKNRGEISKFNLRYSFKKGSALASLSPHESIDKLRNRAEYMPLVGATKLVKFKAGTKFIRFRTFEKGVAEFFVSGFESSSDVDVYIEDRYGNILAKSNNVGGASESVRLKVNANKEYYLRLKASGTNLDVNAFITSTILTSMAEPNLSQFGIELETHGDWTIYREGNKCHMVTIAQSVTPSVGWRKTKPMFYVGVERRSKSIWISLDRGLGDRGNKTYKDGRVTAFVDRRPTKVTFVGSFLKPLIKCTRQPGNCIDSKAIKKYTKGSILKLVGKTAKDGLEASVHYSLKGYSKAGRRINRICGARANWIVK